MATNHEKLLDTIGEMTVLELSEFVDAFKEKFNVTAVAAPVAAAGGGAAAEAAEEKDEFDVVLTGAGDKKIQVIKAVREITGLGLKEAKEAVDTAPTALKEGVTKEEAEQVQAKIEEAGGSVELK